MLMSETKASEMPFMDFSALLLKSGEKERVIK